MRSPLKDDLSQRVIAKALRELGANYERARLVRRASTPTPTSDRPSLLWRGENAVLGRVPRWANRVFLEEVTERSRRPIGFANLRPLHRLSAPLAYGTSPNELPATAEAFLSPPEYMKPPLYRVYAADHYEELYGELAEEKVTCFAMPYRLMGGVCAHAAIYMSLVMAARFGFRVPAVHEMSYAIAQNTPEDLAELNRSGVFAVRPLGLVELQDLVRTPYVGGEALLESHEAVGASKDAFLGELIHQYLLQGLPAILVIHYDELYAERWWPRVQHKARHVLSRLFPGAWATAVEETKDCRNHAVVLVGIGYKGQDVPRQDDVEEFIFHDPNHGPYLRRPVGHMVKAARMLEAYSGQLAFLVLVPRGVTRRISNLVTAYVNLCGRSHGHKTRRPFDNLLERNDPTLGECNSQYRLLRRGALQKTYFSYLPSNRSLRQQLDNVERAFDWIWAVERYVTLESFRQRKPTAVWFFDAANTAERIGLWQQLHIAEGLFAMWRHKAFLCYVEGPPGEGIRVEGLRGQEGGILA